MSGSIQVQNVAAVSVGPGRLGMVTRSLPEEAPVALVYDGTTHAVMMASPGNIQDLAIGFSLCEGIIRTPSQIQKFEKVSHRNGIEARMWLTRDCSVEFQRRRRSLIGSVGCGLCGIDSLAEATRPLPDRSAVAPQIPTDEILTAISDLREWQPLHDQTHAVHAAGFLSPGRGIILSREDVGRHNALDKLIGALARRGISPMTGAVILTSRVSVEMVQKAVIAGTSLLIAPSGPTAHAMRLADQAGLTLAAFARDGGCEVFTHPWRLDCEVSDVI